MKNYLLAAFFMLLTTGISCKKKVTQPELPPATTTGANTFGCYVDGKPYAIFEVDPQGWGGTTTTFVDNFNDGTLIIRSEFEEPRWWIAFKVKNTSYTMGEFDSAGEYPYTSTFRIIDDNGGSAPTSSNLYGTSKGHTLKVTITKAIKGVQYSGTFYGEMVNEEGKVIQITDGRFDVKK